MTRKKVKLVWIVNDTARKASLKKRRVGLLKKVSELTTLCGVAAFAIIYSPDESEPAFWPTRPEVQQMLIRFQGIPDIERCKKMMNQESYLKERIGKVQEQNKKNVRRNKDVELSYLMDEIHNGKGMAEFDLIELHGLVWLLEDKMRDIGKRVEYFQQVPPIPAGPFPPHQGAGGDADADELGRGGGGGDGRNNNNNNPTDAMLWDQWFIDMMNNSENVAGGSGSMSMPMPHPYGNIGGIDMGAFGAGYTTAMGLPYGNFGGGGGGNSLGLGLLPPHGNNINAASGSASGGNALGLGLPAPQHGGGGGVAGSNAGGSDMGLAGFFGGASDMGLPYDVSKANWANNFSP